MCQAPVSAAPARSEAAFLSRTRACPLVLLQCWCRACYQILPFGAMPVQKVSNFAITGFQEFLHLLFSAQKYFFSVGGFSNGSWNLTFTRAYLICNSAERWHFWLFRVHGNKDRETWAVLEAAASVSVHVGSG